MFLRLSPKLLFESFAVQLGYSGATIGEGTHELATAGVIDVHWRSEPALAVRRSVWAGPDGYEIELSGPNRYYQFLAFTTLSRPSPGTYRVGSGGPSDYDAILSPSSEVSIGGQTVGFGRADSGQLVLRSARPGLDGLYTVYFTGTPPDDLTKRGQVVVSGTFHLR